MKKADLVKMDDAKTKVAPPEESKPQSKSAETDKKPKLEVNPSSINKGLSGL